MPEVYQRTNGVYTPRVLATSDYSLLPHYKTKTKLEGINQQPVQK